MKTMRKLLAMFIAVLLTVATTAPLTAFAIEDEIPEAPLSTQSFTEGKIGTPNNINVDEVVAESFDMRVEHPEWLPEIRDLNGYTNASWAFATIAAAEISLVASGFATNSIDLSELHLLYYAYHQGTDPLGNSSGDYNTPISPENFLTAGGDPKLATYTFARWFGAVSESTLPLSQASSIEANPPAANYSTEHDAAHLKQAVYAHLNTSADGIKYYVENFGGACISCYDDINHFNSTTNAYYQDHHADTNFYVTIVGWDDNYSKTNFNADCQPTNDGAWLVRGNVGTSFGDQGYYWISYEDAALEDSLAFAFQFESPDDYDYNHQYDGGAYESSITQVGATSAMGANVFTAQSDESLEAVSFFVPDVEDASYYINVYVNPTDPTDPTSGTLSTAVASGYIDLSSYITAELSDTVILEQGDKFAVVIEVVSECGEDIEVQVDQNGTTDYFTSTTTAAAGQSFYSFDDGETWTDSGVTGSNVRIKAFSNQLSTDSITGLTAIMDGVNASLSWDALATATAYEIYTDADCTIGYEHLATVDTNSFSINAYIHNGETADFKVRAITAGSHSGWSNVATLQIPTMTIESIAVNTAPTKTSYQQYEYFDMAGLSLTITFTSGDTMVVSSEIDCEPTIFMQAGIQSVNIYYGGFQTTVQVSVSEDAPNSVRVFEHPRRINYFVGDTLNTDGLILAITNCNDEHVLVYSGFTCDTSELDTAGTKTVTVTFDGLTTTFDINVVEVVVDDLSLEWPAAKLNYYVGDTLDTTGMILDVKYNNGNVAYPTTGFTCTPTVLNTAGTQIITVTYEEGTTTFEVEVKEVALESIFIQTMPDQLNYFEGDSLDTTGLKIGKRYNNGTIEFITEGFTCTPGTLATAGTQKITVSYGGRVTYFDVTVEVIHITNIAVKTMPTKTRYNIGDSVDLTGFSIDVWYNDGTQIVLTEGFTCSETVLNTLGAQTLKISYEGYEFDYPVKVRDPQADPIIEAIEVKTMPTKTVYDMGETFDPTGLTLTAYYDDLSTQTITEGFTCTPSELNAYGTDTIKVSYGGFVAEFEVTVNEIHITGIAIESTPTKVAYFVGESLDTAGLTIRATYSNGSTRVLSSGFTCESQLFDTAGVKTITVSKTIYDISIVDGETVFVSSTYTATFTVTVVEIAIQSIEIYSPAIKTEYYVGDTLDISGLVIRANINNGLHEIITEGFTCTPTSLTTEGTQTITVNYQDVTTTYDVTVTAVSITAIAIATLPARSSYYKGETLDTTGLTLNVTYNNGTVETISSLYTCDTTILDTAGNKIVSISYEGFTTTFTVQVIGIIVTSVEILTNPDKMSYFTGDIVDVTGLTLTAHYNNGSTQTITEGFTYEPTVLYNATDAQQITVTYQNCSVSFTVVVIELAITGLHVDTLPSKTSYLQGETLDTSGLSLVVEYNNSTTHTITEGFSCSPTALTEIGLTTITASYGIAATSFTVMVTSLEASIVSIRINTPPEVVDYFVGDGLDTTGLTLLATYGNGETRIINDGFYCSTYELTQATMRQNIVVSYNGLTTSFNVSVEEVYEDSLTISRLPNKTEYLVGDTLSTTGMRVNVIYNNGVIRRISNGFTCTPTTLNTAGTQEITVSYGEAADTSFNVTVAPITITGVRIYQNPNKLNYYTGETLSTEGLILEVSYNNSTAQLVSEGFTCDTPTFTQAGTQTFSVSYSGFTVSFEVTIVDKAVSSIRIESYPLNRSYFVGDTIDLTGLKIIVSYNDGSSLSVSEGFTSDITVFSNVGTNTVTISYAGCTTTYEVIVEAVVMTSIEVETLPTKTVYFVGDDFESSGLTVRVNYNNGTYDVIDSGYSYNPSDFYAAGLTAEFISYNGFDTFFYVTVHAVELASISINTMPVKTEYYENDMLDSSGLSLTALYNNGDTQIISGGDIRCTPRLLTTIGTQTVVATYNGCSTSFTVTVADEYITGIQIRTPADRTYYNVGEVLDTTGLSITALYNSGDTLDIYEGFTCEPVALTQEGTQVITVGYETFTTSYTVNVTRPYIEGALRLSVSQTTAKAGETFEVTVAAQSNPGIVSMKLYISYDNTVLTLNSATDEGLYGSENYFSGSIAAVPFIAAWNDADATENIRMAGELMTLSFTVKDDAVVSTEDITVSYDKNYTKNYEGEKVTLDIYQGSVEIIGRLPGDANNDGTVDLMDVTVMRRWLAGWDNSSIDLKNADVNGDDVVNLRDITILCRYLAGGWGVTLL